MTKFSPAARAVLIACNTAVERLPLTAKPEQFSIALIAAALRAAANHIRTIGPWVGHIDSPGLDWAVLEIASIAAELEGHV